MYGGCANPKEETMEQNDVTNLLKQADQLYAQGRLEDAREFYEQALDQDQTLAWAHNRIGAILAQLGEAEAAEQAFLKALELDSALPQAHSNLGNLYFSRGDYDSALAKYKEAVALDPSNPVFHENLHAAYKKLRKFTEAVAALKLAHRLQREASKAEARVKFGHLKGTMQKRMGCGGATMLIILLTCATIFIVVT